MSEHAETVIAAVKAALEEIVTGNGYPITIRSVQRYDRRTLSTADKPCIHLIEGERRRERIGDGWDVHMDLELDLYLYHDPEDTRSTAEVLTEAREAVTTALTQEIEWGATFDLDRLDDVPFEIDDEDSVEDGILFSLTVYYRLADFRLSVPSAI